MTTSLCKSAISLFAGAALLFAGCAAPRPLETLVPLQWAGAQRQEGSTGFSWAGESGKGQWAGLRVAVFPVYSMTPVPAPLEALERLIVDALTKRGVQVLERSQLEQFMKDQRIRYTGGIDRTVAAAIKKDLGVEAVFITSLVHFDEADPPKISLMARLVYLGRDLEIMWMDGYCRSGNDSPGILDLGIISEPEALMKDSVDKLASSMMLHLADKTGEREDRVPGKSSRPEDLFRSPDLEAEADPTIAVLPFLNLSERDYAWEIVPLHFVKRLADTPGIRVIEPGEVRRSLLNYRIFLQGGLSRPNLELFLKSTETDLAVSGTVMRYLDVSGVLKDAEVEFSVEIFDRASEEVVLSSRSAAKGSDDVFFFDQGKKSTACSLADALVYSAISGMFDQPDAQQTPP